MSLVTAVATKFKQRLESITLVPSDDGRFEVELDDELIWSKLDTGEFPDATEMIGEIEERL